MASSGRPGREAGGQGGRGPGPGGGRRLRWQPMGGGWVELRSAELVGL